jgi:hypothetical protein
VALRQRTDGDDVTNAELIAALREFATVNRYGLVTLAADRLEKATRRLDALSLLIDTDGD